MTDQPELWIFAYGSLMWDPGFAPQETAIARLEGYSRAFSMRSIQYRGTVETPGLVLALERAPGAHCLGLALRVPDDQRQQVLADLRERELITNAYIETPLPVTLADGRVRTALAYVIDPAHWQYCGGMDYDQQARIISTAHGGRGPNADYLYNTVSHLAELGLDDPTLKDLVQRVRRLTGQG
ncbi:gamma-glutamylcyclotransferase [Paracoccus pacificus]|uniref:glutathione-specific gamma-glutamylcyclotransferase n=1 Tax=Paracoccus pacificus TaxID=1463598 RepID=A0ABW4RAG0_9RHOB